MQLNKRLLINKEIIKRYNLKTFSLYNINFLIKKFSYQKFIKFLISNKNEYT